MEKEKEKKIPEQKETPGLAVYTLCERVVRVRRESALKAQHLQHLQNYQHHQIEGQKGYQQVSRCQLQDTYEAHTDRKKIGIGVTNSVLGGIYGGF